MNDQLSNKRIAFFYLDEPPTEVAPFVEPYAVSLAERLEIHPQWVKVIDLKRIEVGGDELQSFSCIIFAGLWPIEMSRIERFGLQSLMNEILQLNIPILALGTAERFLLQALDYNQFIPTSHFGLNLINHDDTFHELTYHQRRSWGWRVADLSINDPSVKVLERDVYGQAALLRHGQHIYSSAMALGVSWHEMASWLKAFPQYLKGNEVAFERNDSDLGGLMVVQQFIEQWHDECCALQAH
jgi:hypothetical protein